MQERFPVLHLIALLFRLVAVLIVIGAVLLGGFSIISDVVVVDKLGGGISLIMGAVILVGGLLIGMSIYAFTELIFVLLALEKNTRGTAEALTKMRRKE